jgi:maleylacetate reductase
VTETRFAYQTRAVRVVFGVGALALLGEELDRSGARRALLIGTPGRADMIHSLRENLGSRIVAACTRAAVHVPVRLVAEVLEIALANRADCVVTLGGGSAIGLGKALARQAAVTIVAIPTTYSGSEMTSVYGVTEGERKTTGRDERVAPAVVIYDPELTRDLPVPDSAASGVNAVAHCVEALYARDANPPASLFAEEGLRLLAGALPRIVEHARDLPGRSEALLGAHFAGRALDATTMGLHHRLCHVLGGLFGLPHALTHAILLPHVIAFIEPSVERPAKLVASVLGAADATSGLTALNHAIGISATLRDLGLQQKDLERAAEVVAESKPPSPRPATAADVRRILESAL